MGLYFLCQGIFILISQFGWVAFAKRFGKNVAYYFAVFFYVSALLSWLAATPSTPFIAILARAIFTGLGAGGVLLIGQSLLPDTMQYDYQKTGIRREGVFAGVYTTAEKLSFALGPAIMGLLLSAAGYIAGPDAASSQSSESLWIIYGGVSIFPAIGITAAGIVMTGFRLDEDSLKSGEERSR